MAAPKKTTTKPKTTKTADTKAPAKPQDALNEIVEVLRGFQLNTLVAMALAFVLFICLIFPDLRYIWWINIPLAGASGYLFWSQSNQTEGAEQKICRWGLLLVVVMFIARDVMISEKLAELDASYGELNDMFS